LLPEIYFDEEGFIAKVRETVAAHKFCVVVAGEGLKNKHGEELAADMSRLDAFGHPVLSGAAEHLADLVQDKLKLKARSVKLGYAQRAAAHYASAADAAEAAACGEAAVRAAVEGKSGYMVEHLVPRDWISEDGFMPNEKFVRYAQPLIEGEVQVPVEGGLPKFAVLEKVAVEKKLAMRM
jgi:6-phosphofructokinase 1